ncbi:MAG: matrixin family metalloprotease [Parafilimonas sp.]
MLKLSIGLLILILISGCRKEAMFSLSKNNSNKIVAILPLSISDENELLSIKDQISNYFHVRVIILQQQTMPQDFESNYEDMYSADLILSFLSKIANDSIVEVIGLTHKDIYVTDELKIKVNGNYKKLPHQKDVFGLGYIYGNACIISDYRLTSQNEDLLNNRIRKVVFHEIGHNLGLEHCSNDSCLMSESNGNITVLNKPGGDFCENCKRKLR